MTTTKTTTPAPVLPRPSRPPQSLRAYLRREHLSQEAFAKRLGVTQSAVSQWVTHDRQPSRQQLKVIHKITGIPYEKLLDRPKPLREKKR